MDKLTAWKGEGGVMIHYTVVGELLMMKRLNGHNGGFPPTFLKPDNVDFHHWNNQIYIGKVPTGKYRIEKYWSYPPGYRNGKNGEKIKFGEQLSRHTDYSLMYLGLAKGSLYGRPGTHRYLNRTLKSLGFL